VADGSHDEGAVRCHQRHLGREVVSMLAPILCDVRRQQLLQTAEGAGCQHLGSERVLLELREVRLVTVSVNWMRNSSIGKPSYGEVAIGDFASSRRGDLVGGANGRLDGVLFELDRHRDGYWVCGRLCVCGCGTEVSVMRFKSSGQIGDAAPSLFTLILSGPSTPR
jgi:hypothetical protein